jgi:hypothetical protein
VSRAHALLATAFIIYSARSTTHVTRWFITTSLFPSESAVPASSSTDNNHIVDIVVVVGRSRQLLACRHARTHGPAHVYVLVKCPPPDGSPQAQALRNAQSVWTFLLINVRSRGLVHQAPSIEKTLGSRVHCPSTRIYRGPPLRISQSAHIIIWHTCRGRAKSNL